MAKELNIAITKRTIQYSIIGVCLIAFALFTFWLRTLPMGNIVTDTWVNLLGNDPWYSLRQIEQMAISFPSYSWFDPMTHFPYGEAIYWGPLFRQLAVVLVILAGASTRPEIMYAASFLPPLMAAAMVPVMYGLGAKLVDWKTGIISAAFIAIVPGQYAYRSLFGFVDHHIAETLFSTLFCLCFIIALMKMKESGLSLDAPQKLLNPVLLYPAAAGIAFLLGFYTMTTMVIFGVVVVLYTIVQVVIDHARKCPPDYLILTNCVTFLVVILGIIPFGLKTSGLSVGVYSPGNILVYGLIIIGSLLLYGVSRALQGRPWYLYPGSLVLVAVASLIAGYIALPDLVGGYIGQFTAVFGMQAVVLTVQEAMPWPFEMALSTFNWAWILVAGGVVYLLYRTWKEYDAPALFVLVWFALIFLATTRQIRFEYYFASNIALMAAIAVGAAIQIGGLDLLKLTGAEALLTSRKDLPAAPLEQLPEKKGKKQKQPKKQHVKQTGSPLSAGALVLAVIVALLFAWSGVSTNIAMGSASGGINSDWLAALTWLGANSPDPGVDYYAIYSSPTDRNTFEYPSEAYGVLSWWDYGHWITFVSKRIPHANPFQRGATSSATFFVETDGDTAAGMLDDLGIRYVITDIEMVSGKFWAMATWYDPINATGNFQKRMLYQESETSLTLTQVDMYRESFYQTMIQRLHVYDGSATDPGEIWVIKSMPASLAGVAGASYPVITGVETVGSLAEADAYIESFKKTAPAGHTAEILSPNMIIPSTELDALKHIRLVYESPTNVASGGGDIRYVKVFEVVPGATLRGEGTISIPIKTNTGRSFVYRQKSQDGVFILPYPTEPGPYDVVRATGPYMIIETGSTISVPYEAVMEGHLLN